MIHSRVHKKAPPPPSPGSLKKRTSTQQAQASKKVTGLLRQVNEWMDLRTIYIPAASLAETSFLQGRTAVPSRGLDVRLWLPSTLSLEQRSSCLGDVVSIELNYRLAQATDCVANLCHARRTRYRLWSNYRHQIAGEGGKITTRARSEINAVQSRVNRTVESYRTAFEALVQLQPDSSWQDKYGLYELRDEDNRGPTAASDKIEIVVAHKRQAVRDGVLAADGQLMEEYDLDDSAPPIIAPPVTTDGRYEPSWIWRGRKLDDMDDEEYMLQVRSEWAQAEARRERWTEETQLLTMEMQRTLLALRHSYDTWIARASSRDECGLSGDMLSGIRSYAHKQASVARLCARYFISLWYVVLSDPGPLPAWWASAIVWLDDAEEALLSPPSGLAGAIYAANLRSTDYARHIRRRRGYATALRGSLPSVDAIIAEAVALVHSAPDAASRPESSLGCADEAPRSRTVALTRAAARLEFAKAAETDSEDDGASHSEGSDLAECEGSEALGSDEGAFSDDAL
jgi:hypothetical protein